MTKIILSKELSEKMDGRIEILTSCNIEELKNELNSSRKFIQVDNGENTYCINKDMIIAIEYDKGIESPIANFANKIIEQLPEIDVSKIDGMDDYLKNIKDKKIKIPIPNNFRIVE